MEETGAHLISYQQDSECFLNLELTFDQTNPNPKIGPTATNSPKKVMQCTGIFKTQFYGVVEDFKLNLPIKEKN
jgi:hypothetical protein